VDYPVEKFSTASSIVLSLQEGDDVKHGESLYLDYVGGDAGIRLGIEKGRTPQCEHFDFCYDTVKTAIQESFSGLFVGYCTLLVLPFEYL
jgi:hypothetical protein